MTPPTDSPPSASSARPSTMPSRRPRSPRLSNQAPKARHRCGRRLDDPDLRRLAGLPCPSIPGSEPERPSLVEPGASDRPSARARGAGRAGQVDGPARSRWPSNRIPPAGEFWMGSLRPRTPCDPGPGVPQASWSGSPEPFYLGETEVTVGQFAQVRRGNRLPDLRRDRCPKAAARGVGGVYNWKIWDQMSAASPS